MNTPRTIKMKQAFHRARRLRPNFNVVVILTVGVFLGYMFIFNNNVSSKPLSFFEDDNYMVAIKNEPYKDNQPNYQDLSNNEHKFENHHHDQKSLLDRNTLNPTIIETSEHSLFHLILTTSQETINWRVMRAIESVFYHHPTAKVIMHSNSIPFNGTILDNFSDTMYDFEVKPYDFQDLLRQSNFLNRSIIEDFMEVLQERRNAKFWYSHETDLIRFLLLEKFGGVYIDIDIHFIKSLPSSFRNSLGYQGRGEDKVNGAVMIFDANSIFLRECIIDALIVASKSYVMRDWEIFGPRLLTRHYERRKNESSVINALSYVTFYPYGIYRTRECFYAPKENYNPVDEKQTIAVHLNTGLTKEYNYTEPGSVCEEIFNLNCIFC